MHKGDGALGDTRRAGKAGAVGEGDCDGSPFRGERTPYPQKQSVWIEGRICRRAARPLAAVPGYQCCIRHRWFPTASDGGVGADTIRPLASACIRADALIATVSGVAGSLRRRGVTPPCGGIADSSNRSLIDRATGPLSHGFAVPAPPEGEPRVLLEPAEHGKFTFGSVLFGAGVL